SALQIESSQGMYGLGAGPEGKEAARRGRWLAGVFGRGFLLGAASGGIAVAGSLLVLGGSGRGVAAQAVVVATAFVATAIGLWAGAPEAVKDEVRLGDRWLMAGALTAAGGSFATMRTIYENDFPGLWWQVGGLILGLA